MPSLATSSIRPMNGDTMYAPISAAKIAWAGEKTSVTLTLMPSSVSRLPAAKPSGVIGTFTTAFGAFCERPTPWSYIALGLGLGGLERDVAGHRLEDLLPHHVGVLALLGDQRRVRRDT